MLPSAKYPDTNLPATYPDSPPVKIERFASVSAVCLLLNWQRWQVIAHTLGFYYQRGRLGRLTRRRCHKWMTRQVRGRGTLIAIGADNWPIEVV